MDYISYIRSKVGHDRVILNFAGGILADEEGRVLLQLRGDKKTWAIPGGAMELGETSLQAAVREFHEETGNAVEAKRLLVTKFRRLSFCMNCRHWRMLIFPIFTMRKHCG